MPRKPITSALLEAMASQLNDVPLSAEKARIQAAALEGLMTMIAGLRRGSADQSSNRWAPIR